MNKLLVIDTETGGLDPSVYSILSLGAVVWNDGELEDEFEVFINEPDIKAEARALEINGIKWDWLRGHGVPPAEAVGRLDSFVRAHFSAAQIEEKIPIAGHNAGFDVAFLKRLYSFTEYRYNDLFSHRILDTAGIIRFLILADKIPLRSAGSDAGFEFFKIEVGKGERHTALGDARATAELLSRAVDLIK
jgi:DNA polymerase-3 subunit epsilon